MTVTPAIPLTKHPAKFSAPILEALGALVRTEQREWGLPIKVLDPFAGVGRIHQLSEPGRIETVGIEIEAPWAACDARTWCGDSLAYMRTMDAETRFHVVATSPCYGNRMADHHNAQDGSVRRSYKHDLGHDPDPASSATLPWGPAYWAFHAEAYQGMFNVLVPGGALFLNVSNFVSRKQIVHAVEWHDGACWGAGFMRKDQPILISTQRQRFGENHQARVEHEVILCYRKPG